MPKTARLTFAILCCCLSVAAAAQSQQPNWIEVAHHPQSVIPDLSGLNEKPAGTRGRVQSLGDRLVFADGSEARFWGANLQANALFSTQPKNIKLHAKRLAALGFNLVRIHHHDSHWVRPNVFRRPLQSTRQLNRQSLRKLDLWIEALKAEGIYIWLDLHVGRRLVAGDDVDAFQEIADAGKGRMEGFNFVSPSMKARMKEFQSRYLRNKNHLSGLRYSEDPAIIAVLITNENDVTHHFGHQLLPGKGYPAHSQNYMAAAEHFAGAHGFNPETTARPWEGGPSKLFLNDLENTFFSEMSDDLRVAGYDGMVVPTNFWGRMPLSSLPSLSRGAMIDVHSYGKGADLAANPVHRADLFSWIASGQVAGMPLSISEWNVNEYPTADRFIVPLRMAALASHHGWDAPMIYGYAQQALNGVLIASNWDVVGDPAVLSTLPASALLFRQKHVRKAQKTYALRLSPEEFFGTEISPKTSAAIRTLYEQSALIVEIPPVPELPWLAPRKASGDAVIVTDPAQSFLNPKTDRVSADTGDFARNFRQKVFRVETEMTQAVAGNLKGKSFELGAISLQTELPMAAVSVQSLDGKGIAKSHDILISLTTRTRPKKQTRGVFLIENLQGELRIKGVAGLTLRNLRGNVLRASRENDWYVVDLSQAIGENWLRLSK